MPIERVVLGIRIVSGAGYERQLVDTIGALTPFEERDIGGLPVKFYNDPTRPWLCNYDSFEVRNGKLVKPSWAAKGSKCGSIFQGGIVQMVAHRVLHGNPANADEAFVYGVNNEYEPLLNDIACKLGVDLDAKGKGIELLKRLYPETWETLVTDPHAFLTLTIPVILDFVNWLIDKRNACHASGVERLDHVTAANLMVSTSSKQYDPARHDEMVRDGILSYHIAFPTLYTANLDHRNFLKKELEAFEPTEALRGIVDLNIYTSNRKMRILGAQKIDGLPMIPLAYYMDTSTGGKVSFASHDGAGSEWWELSVPTICDHAWTFVDPKLSNSIFLKEQVEEHIQRPLPSRTGNNLGASLRPRMPYAGGLLSALAIQMVDVYKSFCERHGVPFDLDDFRLTEAPGSMDDLPTIMFSMAPHARGRICPVTRVKHDSNSFKLACTESGRGVLYLCFGGARGSVTAMCGCTASGDPTPHKTNYVRNLNGGDKYCSSHFVGLLPQPDFEVPTDLELESIVIPNGERRLAPFNDALLFGRATDLLRERGVLQQSECGAIILRANLKSGKSYAMYRWLARLAREARLKLRFVFAVPKKVLVASVYHDLTDVFDKEELPDFWKCQYATGADGKLDTALKNKSVRWHTDSIVCCTQSLANLSQHDTIDVFIVDEVHDAVTQAAGMKRGEPVTKALITTIKHAKKVILADGFADSNILKLCEFACRPAVTFDCSDLHPFDGVSSTTILPFNTKYKLCPAYAFEYVIERMKADPRLYVHVVVTTIPDMDVMHARAHRAGISVALIYGDQASRDKATALNYFKQETTPPANGTPRLFITTPTLQGGVSNLFCALVVTFVRAWTVSGYSVKQAECRARCQKELVRIVMDPRLISSRAHRTVGATERYCNYGLLDDDIKKEVDAQTWNASHAELKIHAAKEGFGLPQELPLRDIPRPFDYIYLSTKKNGVLARFYLGEPERLDTEEEVNNDRTYSDRVLQSIRTAEANADVTDIYARSRAIAVDNSTLHHAYFQRSVMLEARNRAPTMLDWLTRADKRMGIQGAIEFKPLDEETVKAVDHELQTTKLWSETKRLLTGIQYYHELYAPTADADARHTQLVQQLRREKESGNSLTNKRKQVSQKPAAEGNILARKVADLVSKYDALLEPQDMSNDALGDELGALSGVLDANDDGEVETSSEEDTERDAMAKLFGIAVTSFTQANVDNSAQEVGDAATAYEDAQCATGTDGEKRLKEAAARLRKANSTWLSLFEDQHQVVFRALALFNKLQAEHGDAKGTDGKFVYAAKFREYAKAQAQRGNGRGLDLLDLVVADELLRVVGFEHGLFTNPTETVGKIHDDLTERLVTQHSEAWVAMETARTAAIRAACRKLEKDPKQKFEHNLSRSVQRLLKDHTKVLSWGMRASKGGDDDYGLVSQNKRWSVHPSPLLAWCGIGTHGVNDAWTALWAAVSETQGGGGGRDDMEGDE